MKATKNFPMPTTKELYDMFKDMNEAGNFPVPFSNIGFYAVQLLDFYADNEQPISYPKAMRIARSMRNMDRKEHPLYKQEIKIMRNIAIELRSNGSLGEYRTFSESRANGRRLKFWGINRGVKAAVLFNLEDRIAQGLRVAGYQLKWKVYTSGSYNTTNIDITITRIGS